MMRKQLLLFLVSCFIGLNAFSQSDGDYRSRQTGNWNTVTTWEVFNSGSWNNLEDAGAGAFQNVIPSSSSGIVTMMDLTTVTIPNGQSITADQIEYENNFGGSTGILSVASGGTLTINNGSGDDVRLLNDFTTFALLEVSGTLQLNTGATLVDDDYGNLAIGPGPVTSDTYKVYNGGVHIHTTGSGVAAIPAADWQPGSTCQVNATSGTVPTISSSITFHHFIWNGTGQTALLNLNSGLRNLNGDLTVTGTNAQILQLSTTVSHTLNIGNDFIIQGNSRVQLSTTANPVTINVVGDFIISSTNASVNTISSTATGNLTVNVTGDFNKSNSSIVSLVAGTTGTMTLNIQGNFSFTGGTITRNGTVTSGSAAINFNGSSTRTFTNSGTISNAINFAIATGKTLNLGTSAITGSGTFALNAGGTIGVGSADGLSTGSTLGNIRVLGTRTYTANGNIIYNGTTAQNLGDEWSSSGALNGVAVNLEIANTNSSGVTNNIIGSTSLVGNLTLISNPFNIGNSNTLIIQSNFTATGGTIGGLSTSNLTFSGSGTITGNLNFATGSQNLNNLTISRDATIALGTPLTISGTLSFTEAGEFRFYGQSLTISGNITQSGGGASGGLESNSTSNLTIGGTGALSALPFVTSSQLNNLTMGRTSGGTYTLGSALTINGTLSLNAGTLTHNSGLTMASGSTFSRNAGASIATNAPNTSTSYNVSYVGILTTGLELPSSATALNNLSVAGDATLDKTITINGDLNITSGTFNASTFSLTMAGDDFLINGGSFTINSASTVTFSRAGITTMGGSTIGGTQFGNLTVNSGATLSAPSANINISGTWNNQGSFTPNSGTVTFNGASQNIDPNGQPFNNVDFAGTGTKTLQGALDVNGTLTITSTLDVGANNSINVAGSWTNNGTFTAAGGTVSFDGTSQTISPNGQSFFNLTLAISGTKTLGGAIDINGALVINNSVTFDVSATAYAVTIAGNWTNNGTFNRRTGTVTFDGTTAIAGSSATDFHNVTIAGALTASSGTTGVSGNWLYSSGSFTANNGTIQFNGGSAQSITSGAQSFSNVVIGGSNTKTFQDNVDINGGLTLGGGTLAVGSIVNVAGNFDASGGGILSAGSGLFIFDGAAQNITSAGELFNNVEFSGSGTKTLLDAFDANGNMDINVALAAGSNSINVAGNWDATGGSFSATGTTTFDGAAQNITSNGSAFGAVTIAGSGTKTLQDALDANGNLTISSTLGIGAGNFAVAVGGNWNSSAGTFAPAATSTVTLDGAAQNITLGGANNFRNLTLAGSGTKTQLDDLDINGNLIIGSGLVLSAGGNGIEITGSWTNNVATGGYAAAGGLVTFDGGGTSDVNGSGTTVFNAINITGNTNVEIETTHSTTGTLTLVGASARFDADGSGGAGVFTLISSDDDPTVDARVAALTTPANFIGNVTVQRFMSQESMPSQSNNRLYRYISSPVSGAAVSQIQSEIPVTGSFTGSSSCSGCGSSASMYRYDEAIGTTFDDGWVEFPDASNTETLQQGVGYGLFVRGNIIPSALWDVRGPVFSGNINLPVTYNNVGGAGAAGFNLVGNPYPSAIDWDLIHPSATNIANAVYVRDNPNGRYTMYVGGVGTNGGSKDIAMGQAFWVEATAASPVLPLTESVKSSSATVFFRSDAFDDLLRIVLKKSDLSDETVIRFHKEGSDAFDEAYDARKLANTIFNLSTVLTEDKRLAINTLGSLACGREVKLDITNVTNGSYELSLAGFESFNDQVSITLFDAFNDQIVDVRTSPIYGFTIDTNQPNTFGAERFKVIFEFKGSAEQPELVLNDVCQGSDAILEISNSKSDLQYSIYANGVLIKEIGAGTGTGLSVTIPKEKLVEGENTFKLKTVNTFCDQIVVDKEFVIKNESLPVTTAAGASSCLAGSVMLSASGASDGSYRWYETAESTQPLEGVTGSTFTTPVIPKTKTYFVSSVNDLGCEGARTEVVAEIINYDPVTISEPEPGVFVSSYEEGNQWFKDGELLVGFTGRTIAPTESGIYSVEVKIGSCTTSSQLEFSVTGINDEGSSWDGHWKIYPNPVSNVLIIESKEAPDQQPVIFEPSGRKVGTIPMKESNGVWIGNHDFSGKPRGIYILQVLEKGAPKFKRIIKD